MKETLADKYFKPSLVVKLIVWSFLMINIFNWEVEAEDMGFPSIVKYLFSVSSIVIIIYAILKRPVELSYYGIAAPLVIAFALYSLYMVAGSFRTDTKYFQLTFGAKYYVLAWLYPVFLLFIKTDILFLRYYVKFSQKILPYCLVAALLILAFLNVDRWLQHFYGLWVFDIAATLLVLTLFYVGKTKRDRYVIFGYFFFTAILSAYYGRRGILFNVVEILLFFLLLRLNNPLIKVRKKSQTILYSVLLLIAVVAVANVFASKLFIFERGLDSDAWDESRGRVVDEFFADFTSQSDWLFGRGIDGRVLRTIDLESGGMGDTIENGFLYTLLKGGGIFLGLQMAIFLISAYLAWFKSRNHYTKAFSAMILIHIVGMVSYNLPVFSMSYINVWLVAVMGYSSAIRGLTNKQIQVLLN